VTSLSRSLLIPSTGLLVGLLKWQSAHCISIKLNFAQNGLDLRRLVERDSNQ